jgi:hypothetical protein
MVSSGNVTNVVSCTGSGNGTNVGSCSENVKTVGSWLYRK